uniref:RluA family pseudouridine synthase n=1 Tax=Angelakisella sp. TaxID=1935177 RepID=UPI003FEE37D0
DKDTTGAVVVARHQIAAGKLWKAVTKRYVAVVSGVPQPPEGLIDLPLEREIPLEMKRVVSPDGERAVTEYKVLATAPDESCALVGFILHTGRTHQIRVHMAEKGWPLLGDELYGGPMEEFPRQALHCAGVAFTHPITGEQLCLTAPLPEDMAALLKKKGIGWRPVLTPFVEELLTVQPTTVEEITERYRKPKQKGRP